MRKLSILIILSIIICLVGCGNNQVDSKAEANTIIEQKKTEQEESKVEVAAEIHKNEIETETEAEINSEPETKSETIEAEAENPTIQIAESFDLISYLEGTNADYIYTPEETEKSAFIAVYGDWQIEIYTTDFSDQPTLILNDCGTETRCIYYDFKDNNNNDTTQVGEYLVYTSEIEVIPYIAKCLVSNKLEGNAPGIVPIIDGFTYPD